MRTTRVSAAAGVAIAPRQATLPALPLADLAWPAAIMVLAFLQTALILGHRPWIDEWQALQIALESPTLADLFENLRYEGHPPLWYLILRVLGSVVPTSWVLVAALAPIALVTQAVILWRAPFTRAERLMLAAGELMMFEYLTLSRSMSLGVMCVVLAIALRRSRWGWVPLALLPMCDFLFGAISVALMVLHWRDRRLWAPGAALWVAMGLAAAWFVRPAADLAPSMIADPPFVEFGTWIARLGVLLVPLQTGKVWGLGWNGPPPLSLGVALGPLFLWFAYRQTRGRPLDRVLLGGFIALMLVFSLAVYPLHTRHLTLSALLLIVLRWRGADEGDAPDAGFRLWLGVGAACGLLVAALNLAVPFDTAREATQAIRAAGLQHRTWATFPDSTAEGVSALGGIEFVRLRQECRQSFVRWNGRSRYWPWTLARYLRDLTHRHGRIYLLTDLPLDRLNGGYFDGLVRRVADVPTGFNGQVYNLLVVAPDQPDRGWRPRPCVARRVPMTPAL